MAEVTNSETTIVWDLMRVYIDEFIALKWELDCGHTRISAL